MHLCVVGINLPLRNQLSPEILLLERLEMGIFNPVDLLGEICALVLVATALCLRVPQVPVLMPARVGSPPQLH